ncbi:hypothetical protein FRB90_008508 [Tulasnella sp. 427]|nr:hypothetical protein FRB90_008508 [Tulasnella sp. 427]
MWLTLRRKFMNLAEIDLIYQVAEKDALATFASSAVVKSPLLVVVAALTFILPISTVLAPSSLRVVPHISTSWKSCQIPSGNLANDGSTLYLTGFRGFWSSSSPAGQQLAIATLVGQQILPIRSVCGSDCEYSVSFPSVAIQCQSGAEIPEGMKGEDQIGGQIDIVTYWNATPVHPLDGLSDPSDPFYVYWNSHDVSGSSGQARCTVGLAQYSFTIRYSAGQQSVSYNVTHTGDRIFPSLVNSTASEMRYSDQLLSVAFSARFVLLGALSDVVLGVNGLGLTSDSLVTSAAFLDSSSESFIWGDVVGGIEQLSHNISAGILTLNLGVQDGQCLVDTLDVVYQYDWLNLFLPYAIIFLLCSLCVAAGIIAFFRFNPENLTSSFSDTVSITRNPTLDTFVHEDEADETRQENSSLRLRLGKLRTGGLRFGTLEDLKSE